MNPDQELAKERHRNLTIWKEAMALRKSSDALLLRCSDAEVGQDSNSGVDRPSTLDLLRNLIRNS